MTAASVQSFLLWCLLLNYSILLVWFLMFWLGHGWMLRLHNAWFRLSNERFDAIHYGCMAVYKVGILLLNLVPYVALRLVVAHAS